MQVDSDRLQRLLLLAIEEDLGKGDITSLATIPAGTFDIAAIRAKQSLIVAGTTILQPLWEIIDPEVRFDLEAADGDRLESGQTIATVRGLTRSLLAGERPCLNILCHLCGIATLTAQYVAAVGEHKAKILDTRKTLPGMRELEKLAVKAGGGHNHRIGLYDQILIKDNHIQACGGVAKAVASAIARFPGVLIEVEVRNEKELEEAIQAGANIVLLDNMNTACIRRCVEINNGRAELEVSGGVQLERIAELAATGVDRISVGALTHSAPSADIHMKLVPR